MNNLFSEIMTDEEFTDFTEKLKKVSAYIDRNSTPKIEKIQKIEKKQDGVIAAYTVDEFTQLQELLNSDQWPLAVDRADVCNEQDHERMLERAAGILEEVIETSFTGLKFLDFGCGQGYGAKQAVLEGAALGVGYDIVASPSEYFTWEQREGNFLLTSSLETVKQNAPYDIIMVYDVLDHLSGYQPQQVLGQIREMCNENTQVYVRCHPWCSRHGGHAYTSLNKAFVHLIFNEEELKQLGVNIQTPDTKVLFPLATYRKWFEESGFSIWWEDPDRETPVEKFFSTHPLVKRRIMATMNQKANATFPVYQLEQSWNDFTLAIRKKS